MNLLNILLVSAILTNLAIMALEYRKIKRTKKLEELYEKSNSLVAEMISKNKELIDLQRPKKDSLGRDLDIEADL